MNFYKLVVDKYILFIGIGNDGEQISEEEYSIILNIIRNKPLRTETVDYRLKTDLTWEAYELPPQPESEPTAEEALSILLGGAV